MMGRTTTREVLQRLRAPGERRGGRRALIAAMVVSTAALTSAVVLPTSALAAVRGAWTQVTPSNGSNIEQVAAVRSPDGNLQVLFTQSDPATSSNTDLMHSTITAGGVVSSPDPVQTDWAVIDNPALVLTPGPGLRAFFGGIRTTNTFDPQDGLETATAPATGSPWLLMPGNASITNTSYGADDNAIVAADGTPFITWAGTLGTWVHRGLTPGREYNYEAALGGCCGYLPDLAIDGSTGQLYIAWFSNATGKDGEWAQGVDSTTGAPIGSPTLMPGSQTIFNGAANADPNSRNSITGRPGHPGVFIAYPGGYPTHTKVLLWQVGAAGSTTLAQGANAHSNVTLASTSDGRLWVLWSETRGSQEVVVARRSNPQLTAFGAPTMLAGPARAISTYRLGADAQDGGTLDVLGSFGLSSNTVSTWHAQLMPSLSLTVKGSVSRRGHSKVTIVATDAGIPVPNVLITFDGKKGHTNSQGTVTFKLSATNAKKLKLTSSDAGYTGPTLTLKTRR